MMSCILAFYLALFAAAGPATLGATGAALQTPDADALYAQREDLASVSAIRYRGDIKAAPLVVLELDPAYQQGTADRALRRWYSKSPACSAGAIPSPKDTSGVR